MPEQTDFFNLYVQNLVTEVTELTKTKILLDTQNAFKDTEIGELTEKIEKLEEQAATEKDLTTKVWKTTLEEKDQEIAKEQTAIADLRRRLSARENELTAAQTSGAEAKIKVEELQKEVKAREEIIANLNAQLNIKSNSGEAPKEAPKAKKKTKKEGTTYVPLE